MFSNFPCIVTRVVPTLYHVIPLSSEASFSQLKEWTATQVAPNKLCTSLVINKELCVYVEPNGEVVRSTQPPLLQRSQRPSTVQCMHSLAQ
jgi:hypothetical protein